MYRITYCARLELCRSSSHISYDKRTGAQSTLGGTTFLPDRPKYVWKINQIPEFYTIYARKMPEFYIKLPEKIFFPIFIFFFGGGARAPPAPVSYACVSYQNYFW